MEITTAKKFYYWTRCNCQKGTFWLERQAVCIRTIYLDIQLQSLTHIDRVTRWARYAWTRSGTNTLGRRPRRLCEGSTEVVVIHNNICQAVSLPRSTAPCCPHINISFTKTLQSYTVCLCSVWAMKGELQTLSVRFINYMKYLKILAYHLMIRSFICTFCKVNECFVAVISCSWEPHACLWEMNSLDGSSRSECRVFKWAFYPMSAWWFRRDSLVVENREEDQMKQL